MSVSSDETGKTTWTVRELVDGLRFLASDLPDGIDTQIRIGVCDGDDLQTFKHLDVSECTFVRVESPETTRFILLRAHDHKLTEGPNE